MRHAGTQTLETDRLFLRQLLPEDAEQMYTNWASDPEVTRFLRWEPHKNALETVGLLAAWATLYPNPDYYQWAIVEKASGQVFGSISIFNALLGDPAQKALWPQQDCTDGIWEAGYCIGKHWWNHGFATEALKAAVNYWFENTDGGWLTCCHAKENPASGRVMLRVTSTPTSMPSSPMLTLLPAARSGRSMSACPGWRRPAPGRTRPRAAPPCATSPGTPTRRSSSTRNPARWPGRCRRSSRR